MRALVTGDRGFLGRHFKAELERRGYAVTGLDVKAAPSQDCREFFRQTRKAREFDLVVHCAAVVGGRETIEGDPLATAESLSIDAEMFRWAAKAQPGRVLYFSSSAAYPAALQRVGTLRRLTELDTSAVGVHMPPDEVYGWTKVVGEMLAAKLRRTTGVPVTVVRPFSGYGPDQDHGYPFRDILERAKVLRHGEPLEVWCGTCVRDWVHVDDVVAGALAVCEDGTEDPVNLCTGRATAFFELAELMCAAVGVPAAVRVRGERPQGVAYRVGDPARMQRIYTPLVALETGIQRALEQ